MAMTKLCDGGAGDAVAQQVSDAYGSCLDTVLRQRGHELQLLSQDPELRARVLPRDAGPEALEVMELNHDSQQAWSCSVEPGKIPGVWQSLNL